MAYLLNSVGIDCRAALTTVVVFVALNRRGEGGNPLVLQNAKGRGGRVEKVIVCDGAFPGVGAHLRDERIRPELRASWVSIAFNGPHTTEGKHRTDEVQSRQLVGATGVVRVSEQSLAREGLAQTDAGTFLLYKKHVEATSAAVRRLARQMHVGVCDLLRFAVFRL